MSFAVCWRSNLEMIHMFHSLIYHSCIYLRNVWAKCVIWIPDKLTIARKQNNVWRIDWGSKKHISHKAYFTAWSPSHICSFRYYIIVPSHQNMSSMYLLRFRGSQTFTYSFNRKLYELPRRNPISSTKSENGWQIPISFPPFGIWPRVGRAYAHGPPTSLIANCLLPVVCFPGRLSGHGRRRLRLKLPQKPFI